jgi:hypothetical protein
MATLRVEVVQSGSAFGKHGEDAGLETSRILHEVSDRVRNGSTEGTVHDLNGHPACVFRTEIDS